jgi:choline dehydrogenase
VPTGGGPVQALHCRREVVLCAGAIGTPQILQLSGIGPVHVLQAAGITPRLDHPGVGENLQDHLQIRAVFGVEGVKTLNTMANSLWGKAMIGLEYLLLRSGPMSMAPSQLGAFTRSSDRSPLAERRVPRAAAVAGRLRRAAAPLQCLHRQRVQPEPDLARACACALAPPGGRAAHPGQLPVDAGRPQGGRRFAAADAAHRRMPALARYKPKEVKPGVQFQSDDELARLAGDIGTTIFHPVGTCRMGRADDPPRWSTRGCGCMGVGGLRIADASVMPTITSGNTNSPTLMIAERAAEWVLASA